jgi:hypothetical protein
MALELLNATQVCSWAPPLPQRAFEITSIGVSSDSGLFAGYNTSGRRYNYAVINTTQWGTAEGFTTPPMTPGEQFQLWSVNPSGFTTWPAPPAFGTGSAIPTNSSASSTWSYAPELFNVYGLTQNREGEGANTPLVMADSTMQLVIAVQQISNDSWYVYFSPGTNSTVPANSQSIGLVTVPRLMSPKWLGEIGHVSQIDYTYAMPGGPDQFTCALAVEPNYRTDALNPGRILTCHRGAACVWEGQLIEPQASATGWILQANGVGTLGTNFGAWWQNNAGNTKTSSGWFADGPIDFAIARGLRWTNYGIGSPAGIYLGPVQDPGSLTVTDFLNLLCTGGALTWELVQPAGSATMPPAPWVIKVYPLPTDISGNPLVAGVTATTATGAATAANGKWVRTDTIVSSTRRPPDLYLVNTSPVSRTINNDINTVIVYYEITADSTATSSATATAATYGTTFASIPGSVAAHGRLEYYVDVSNSGAMTKAAAAAIGQNILDQYIRANFAGTFTVQPGQLLNVGGVPVDLGCNWNGAMCTVQVVNEAYGGEVGQAPITFLIGEYEFNDDSQTALITPYQNARTDMSSVVAQLYPGQFS